MTSTLVVLREDACLKTIGALAEQMLEVAVPGADVTLDIGSAVNADLSLVQLIEATRRHGAQVGATVALAAPAGAPVQAVLRRAGFLTDPTPEDIAFWFHGELPQ
ncbi:MAG: STAS domain-containing protein [Sphingomonas fennica]